MGESRPSVDNASASSEEAIKAPPKFVPQRNPGPGVLPAEKYDPLVHIEYGKFWNQIDDHFHPINLEHLSFLTTSLPVNPYNGLQDPDLCLSSFPDADPSKPTDPREKKREAKREPKRERTFEDGKRPLDRPLSIKLKTEPSFAPARPLPVPSPDSQSSNPQDFDPSLLCASLNSYPYTHRLIAALIDENPKGTPAPQNPSNRVTRSSAVTDMLSIGTSSEPDVRSYQAALEERVKLELRDCGLLDESPDEDLQTAIRQEQWKLRDLKTANRIRRQELFLKVVGSEADKQARRRDEKRHEDQVEIAYLERMINKLRKNKKSRSKYQKMLHRMFSQYHKEKGADKGKKAAETHSNGRLSTGDDKIRTSNKKKRRPGKKSNHELPAKTLPTQGGGPSRLSGL